MSLFEVGAAYVSEKSATPVSRERQGAIMCASCVKPPIPPATEHAVSAFGGTQEGPALARRAEQRDSVRFVDGDGGYARAQGSRGVAFGFGPTCRQTLLRESVKLGLHAIAAFRSQRILGASYGHRTARHRACVGRKRSI